MHSRICRPAVSCRRLAIWREEGLGVRQGTQLNRTYALGHLTAETARLERWVQPRNRPARRWLDEAGIGAGMKVLHAGGGVEDVSLLAAPARQAGS